MVATIGQYSHGKGVKPSADPPPVKGNIIPTAQMIMVVAISAGLARLSINGIFAVRMMWMIRVCVRRDSTNHPVLNSEGLLHELNNITP
jgi:hypothetical protein